MGVSMSWPIYRARVTAFELLESGACCDGVARAALKHGLSQPTEAALALAGAHRDYVEAATYSDGYGDGYGDGSGYGYGDGDGYGYGYGDGYGDGYGYGELTA
jgi:hypothetical protein